MKNQLMFIVAILMIVIGMMPYMLAKKGSALRSNMLIVSVINVLCMIMSLVMNWTMVQNVVVFVWIVSMGFAMARKSLFVKE